MSANISIGGVHIPAVEFAVQASATLGIKETGKSYLGTLIGEQMLDAGIPFIAYDPVNIWHNLKRPRPGRGGKGYPIVVAGGDEGDLPLNPASAPAIVEAALREGVSLVLDMQQLSKADWRKIVADCTRLLLQKNKQHGLRYVFLEEAAEFVPQRGMDGFVYAEVEKLVRTGGNSRLGCMMITPRSQEINKAVLELCEHLFLFRQRGKNAIENLTKWFEVTNVTDKHAAEIVASLPELEKGQCWAWQGGDTPKAPQLVRVPQKKSFHPDRRATREDMASAAPKAVDVGGFVEALQAALPKIQEEVAATDPKKLNARIAELQRQLRTAPVSPEAMAKAREEGRAEGRKEGYADGYGAGMDDGLAQTVPPTVDLLKRAIEALEKRPAKAPAQRPAPVRAAPVSHAPAAPAAPRAPRAVSDDKLSGPETRILAALAFWDALGFDQPTNEQVAAVANYSPSSTSFTNPRGALSKAGLIAYPKPNHLALTEAGRGAAPEPPVGDPRSLLDPILSGPERRILDALPRDGGAISNEELAELARYSAASTSYTNPRGSLNKLGLISYPKPGFVAVEPWVFSELVS